MTVTVSFFGVDLVVEGDYQPAEPMVRYYRDGSGYHGCDEDFEVNSVKTVSGDDITELFDADLYRVWKRYDDTVIPRVQIKTVGESLMELLVVSCLEEIEAMRD